MSRIVVVFVAALAVFAAATVGDGGSTAGLSDRERVTVGFSASGDAADIETHEPEPATRSGDARGASVTASDSPSGSPGAVTDTAVPVNGTDESETGSGNTTTAPVANGTVGGDGATPATSTTATAPGNGTDLSTSAAENETTASDDGASENGESGPPSTGDGDRPAVEPTNTTEEAGNESLNEVGSGGEPVATGDSPEGESRTPPAEFSEPVAADADEAA